MYKKFAAAFCVFALASLFCVSASYAGSAVIKSCEGDVMIKAAGSDKWVPAQPNATLNSGDSIQTKAGTAEVVYPDKSVLKVKNNTSTTLSEMKNEKTGQLTRKVKIMVGDMWAKITPGTPTKTEFETPSAVAAVKGTTVSLSVSPTGEVQILTENGSVLATLGANAATVTISDSQAISASIGADGQVNITSLSGDPVTVNMASGAAVTVPPNTSIAAPSDGSSVTVTAGEATVTVGGTSQPVAAGNQATISGGAMTVAPATSAPAPAAGAAGAPQQNTSGDATTNDGKDIAPSNNGNPTVLPEGGNKGSNTDPISPSNP